MPLYNKILQDCIEREKAGTDYFCSESDKVILQDLLEEINKLAGTEFRYLAELDAYTISGAGEIIVRYIQRFSSESVRGYLLPQLVSNRVNDCDKTILKMYMHFKSSDEYLSKPGIPAPSHIYVRYDNAFKALRSKRIKDDLVKLAHCPRDAFYLPLTMRMLASWKVPEVETLLRSYSCASNITAHDIGISENGDTFFPPLDYIKRELRFLGIDGLKHYPSDDTCAIIRQYLFDSDSDIRSAAKKTLKSLVRSTGQGAEVCLD